MQETDFTNGMLDFIAASPTPFHVVSTMSKTLEKNGFSQLQEADNWNIQTPGKYYVTRNDSSIIAFSIGEDVVSNGFRMVGAHTDSPCLKIKPQPEIIKDSSFS